MPWQPGRMMTVTTRSLPSHHDQVASRACSAFDTAPDASPGAGGQSLTGRPRPVRDTLQVYRRSITPRHREPWLTAAAPPRRRCEWNPPRRMRLRRPSSPGGSSIDRYQLPGPSWPRPGQRAPSGRVVPGSRHPHQLYTHPLDVVILVPSHRPDEVAGADLHRGRGREVSPPCGPGQRRRASIATACTGRKLGY